MKVQRHGGQSDQSQTMTDRGHRLIARGIFALWLGLSGTGAMAANLTGVVIEGLGAGDQTAVPVTFGQVVRAGDVPQGSTVSLVTSSGSDLATQADVKTRYPDGSLAHAVVSARVPGVPAGSPVRLTIRSKAEEASSPPSVQLADLLATTFDAVVNLNIGGTSYRVSARDLLARGQVRQWLVGPVASEWVVGGPPVTAGGAAHPQMAVFFHVRAFGKPVDAARVDVVFENAVNLVNDATDVTYDGTVTVGGNVVDSRTVTHFPRSRWHEVFWWGKQPRIYVRHDVGYLQSTKAVPRYLSLTPSGAYLDGLLQEATPMGTADLTPYMPATGEQAQIGPLPRWAAVYLVSGDRRAYKNLIANDSSAGTYRVHYRDPATGRPVSIQNRPTLETLRNTSVASDLNIGADNAHHPSVGYASYLLSGDLFYLEELQFWASYNLLAISSLMREADKGIFIGIQQQMRGQAWIMRTQGQAAFISPDDDPLKGTYRQIVNNNLQRFRALYMKVPVPPDDKYANRLGALRNRDEQGLLGYPPWEDDFFTWSISQLVDLGFDAADVRRWKATFSVSRMGEPTYESCYVNATDYKIAVGETDAGPWLPSMRAVYEANFGPLPAECPDGQAFNSDSHPTRPTGYSSGQMRIGLVAAVNSGVPGAVRAWQKFLSAVSVSRPDYSDYPSWALIPDIGMVKPAPPTGIVIR